MAMHDGVWNKQVSVAEHHVDNFIVMPMGQLSSGSIRLHQVGGAYQISAISTAIHV